MPIAKLQRILEQTESGLHALRHTRPLSLANFLLNSDKPSPLPRTLMWRGRPFYYRPGTSDVEVMLQTLLPVERRNIYHLDYRGRAPAVIVDIGANIGTSALYFATKFPDCTIHAFEPEPSNYDLLRSNTQHLKNVTTHAFGLGSESQSLPLYRNIDPKNRGGYSTIKDGIESSGHQSGVVEIRSVRDTIQQLGISKIDLIKIDAEGAEYEILTAIPSPTLDTVQWIVGELHAHREWELLDFLSRRFEIGMTRSRETKLAIFRAYAHGHTRPA